MNRPDLHTHSTASDGALTPEDLVARAAGEQVDVLALTDHDTVAGVDAARRAAESRGIHLVAGVEISTRWEGREVHIVGLDLDPDHGALRTGLGHQQDARWRRAERIAQRLEAKGLAGVAGVVEGRPAGDPPTRRHFAEWLVEQGYARDNQRAFRRYLGHGKPGYAKPEWVTLPEAVEWIHAAGGVSVAAHPYGYHWTGAWRRRLLDAFCEAGGQAVEVVTGTTTPSQVREMAGMAVRRDLLASVGSDFHGPGAGREPGRLAGLPDGVVPVWNRF